MRRSLCLLAAAAAVVVLLAHTGVARGSYPNLADLSLPLLHHNHQGLGLQLP